MKAEGYFGFFLKFKNKMFKQAIIHIMREQEKANSDPRQLTLHDTKSKIQMIG
jgi:hypothetical protein